MITDELFLVELHHILIIISMLQYHKSLYKTFLSFSASNLFIFSICAQSFKASDIEGQWQSTKSLSEITINISGSNATVTSVGSTTLTRRVIGGKLYEGISFNGASWTAQRNTWRYPGANGVNQEQGRWVELQKSIPLRLSADKNTLTAIGHWTFRRLNVDQSNQESAKPLSFYFALWGNGKDYFSPIINLDASLPKEVLRKKVETFKGIFYKKVKADPDAHDLSLSDVLELQRDKIESEQDFEKSRLEQIDTRRKASGKNGKNVNIISL